MNFLRIAQRATAVVALVVGLSSCSSSGNARSASDSSSNTAVSPTDSVTASVTTPVSSAPANPGSTTADSTVPGSTAPVPAASKADSSNCTNGQLSVTSKLASGGDGNSGLIVIFTNQSSSSCSLSGYPGAADLDSRGTQIEQAKRTLNGMLGGCGCARPKTVRLATGQAASTIVEGNTGGGDACLRGRAVLVTAPNTRNSTRFAFNAYTCDFQVHPVVGGTTGGARPG